MRIHNGYGFNEELVRDGRFFDFIYLEEVDGDKRNFYLIDNRDLVNHGVKDKSDKFDSQLFISMEKLKKLNQLSD